MLRDKLNEAMKSYEQAIRNYEKLRVDQGRYKYSYVDALNNLGMAYGRQGNLDLALVYFRRSEQTFADVI